MNEAATSSLSIAIPTYGRDAVLVDSIRHLLAQEQQADEILVIDQSTSHATDTERALDEWHRQKLIRWIRHQPPGTVGAMNRGLQEAMGDLVLFLDDDIIPAKDLVAAHLRAHRDHPNAWAVVGQVIQENAEKLKAETLKSGAEEGEENAVKLKAETLKSGAEEGEENAVKLKTETLKSGAEEGEENAVKLKAETLKSGAEEGEENAEKPKTFSISAFQHFSFLRQDLAFNFNSATPAWVSNVMAGNLSVKRDRALALGGFDPLFVPPVSFRFETDFAKRIIAAGGRIRFEPAASIQHLRAPRGGTRIHGSHLTSASPLHGVGDYYYALKHGQGWDRVRYIARRPFREVCTKFHLRHPWWIPVKFVGELRAMGMAFRLFSNRWKKAGSDFPIVGKKSAEFSNHWKENAPTFPIVGKPDHTLFHTSGVTELRPPPSNAQASVSAADGGASSASPSSGLLSVQSITLIHTYAPDRKHGSMVRYGQMVRDALASDPIWQVHEINLAPSQAWLSKWPAALQTPIRYACIAWQARTLRREQATILHLLDGSHAYLLGACRHVRVPLVITVHDVIPLLTVRGELGGKQPGRLGSWLIRHSSQNLARANHIVADSSNTAKDITRLVGVNQDRITVVPPPVPVRIELPDNTEGQKAPFVLHVAGNNTFYKNRAGVLRVFARVRESVDIQLKMVGAPPDAALREHVQAMGLKDQVEFVSNVDEVELARLYQSAAVFVFPSLYEGFGWPPLEAMQYGCPVVASNAGSLAEVVGDAALVAEPDDIETLAEHVVRVLRDAGVREALIRKGYERVGQHTLVNFEAGLQRVYQVAVQVNAENLKI